MLRLARDTHRDVREEQVVPAMHEGKAVKRGQIAARFPFLLRDLFLDRDIGLIVHDASPCDCGSRTAFYIFSRIALMRLQVNRAGKARSLQTCRAQDAPCTATRLRVQSPEIYFLFSAT